MCWFHSQLLSNSPNWPLSTCEEASQVTHNSPLRHLGLVFFDILSMNSRDLRRTPYEERRQLLEQLVAVIPGQSLLAERCVIQMKRTSTDPISPVEKLKDIFSRSTSVHQEGLVLKGGRSSYGDFKSPWVKLKKDYIPGLGDCLDLLVLGAGYKQDRAVELGGGSILPLALTLT